MPRTTIKSLQATVVKLQAAIAELSKQIVTSSGDLIITRDQLRKAEARADAAEHGLKMHQSLLADERARKSEARISYAYAIDKIIRAAQQPIYVYPKGLEPDKHAEAKSILPGTLEQALERGRNRP